MSKTSRVAVVAMCGLLTACGGFTLIEAKPQTVNAVYTVQPQISWSRVKSSGTELWTVDGPSLQAVRFPPVLSDGDTLFPSRDPDKAAPKFNKGMVATEIMEFVVDAFDGAGASAIDALDLEPFVFAGRDGFRFKLNFLSEEGLEYDGLVTGAVDDDKLYLVIYTGTRQHYFPKHEKHVERLMSSLRIGT